LSTIPDAPVVAAAPPRPPLRLPLIAALALAFVSLALISGIAYIVVLAGATGTAERLLVDRAARVVDAQVALVRSRLDPVAEHLELIAALAAHGRLDISSPVDMREALWVMMTKVPAISSAGFATFDLKMERVIRYPDGKVTRDTISLSTCRAVSSSSVSCRPRTTLIGGLRSGVTRSSSSCSTCARRCGASTTPSSAACSPPSRSAIFHT